MIKKGLIIGCIMVSTSLHANVIQYYTGLSYNNPSDLFKVKDNELIFGGSAFYVDMDFTGSALNFNTGQYEHGSSFTRRTSLLPYGRIAKRYNQNMVFSIDVTQPFHSNLDWGEDAFTRYANTHNLLTDTDFSPKVEYSFSQKFHVGAGVNFNFLKNNEVNFALPTGPTTYDTLVNRTSGFGVGFNLGATLALSQQDFVDLTYYSKIKQNTRGYSQFNGQVSNNHSFTFNMPETTLIGYTHLFNQQWLANVKAIYTEWDINQYVRLYDTAAQPADFVFPVMFKPSWAFFGVIRNQYNEKLAVSLAGMLDRGPERDQFRNLAFPSYDQYFLAVSGEYMVKKGTVLQLIYGHGWSNPPINNQVTINGNTVPLTTGKVRINADVLDLRLKIEG